MKASYLTIGAVALLSGLVAASGCADDAAVEDDGAGGSGGSGTMMTVGPGGPGATTTTTGGGGNMGDGNDSFDEAVDAAIGQQVNSTLEPADTDADYYKFTAQEGDLILIDSLAKPEADPFNAAYPDLVVTVYNSAQQKVAENDDPYLVRDTNDSEVWYRIPATGEYFIRVTDCLNWELGGVDNCADAAGIVNHEYAILVNVFDPADDGTIEDSEGGDDQNSSPNDFGPEYTEQTAGSGQYFATVAYGTFNDNTDVDVFEINLPDNIAITNRLFGAIFIQGPEGPEGIGTTANIGDAWITLADGTTEIARIDHTLGISNDSRELRAPMNAADTYYLWVAHPGGAAGANDFYIFNHNGADSNPQETDEAGNNTAAELLTAVPNGTLQSAFIGGDLIDGDVDMFEVAVPGSFAGTVSVACGALRSGSGTILNVALNDQAGASIEPAVTESEDDDIVLTDIDPGSATSIQVVLTHGAGSPRAGIQSRFYQCGLHFVPPAP